MISLQGQLSSSKRDWDASGVEDTNHMFIVNLCTGETHDRFRTVAVWPTPTELKKHAVSMEQSFVVMFPVSLFQLLTSTKRREGTSSIGSDGSGEFHKGGSFFVTIGTPAVQFVNNTSLTLSLS